MPNESVADMARHYCVDDLPGAICSHTRLQKILDTIYRGKPLSRYALEFLAQQGLHALHRFAVGELLYDSFYELALIEQSNRIQSEAGVQRARAAEEQIRAEEARRAAHRVWEEEQIIAEEARRAARRAWEAEERRRAEQHRAEERRRAEQKRLEDAARREWESDPDHQFDRELCKCYNIEIDLYSKFKIHQYPDLLLCILKKVYGSQRLDAEDLVWLHTVGERYFSPQLRAAYHRLEADALAHEFGQTHNPWAAINASSHYRKCGHADYADTLLRSIHVAQHPPKIQAAISTTHGGALRDLKEWDAALHLGERAHTLQPKDYRPCTLLGAIYMEIGQYSLGQAWYDKAIERGATVDAVDRDIITILRQITDPQRSALEAFLRQEDPVRWARIENGRRSPRQRK